MNSSAYIARLLSVCPFTLVFRGGEPPTQLSAARLWAIMLRNCSLSFVKQCTSRKFLDALEEVLKSKSTAPVVRERLIAVLAAASYASDSGAA